MLVVTASVASLALVTALVGDLGGAHSGRRDEQRHIARHAAAVETLAGIDGCDIAATLADQVIGQNPDAADPLDDRPFGRPGRRGRTHYTFFDTPDGSAGSLNFGAYAYGNAAGAAADKDDIDSTYSYRGIDPADGEPTLPGVTAGNDIIIAAADVSAGAKLIHVVGISEIEALGDIDVLTNGDITLTEKSGDMRVERIKSTINDVLLYSPARIVDANDDASTAGNTVEADVSGENITLVSGTGLVNPPGTVDAPGGFDDGLPTGGIGEAGNFLEIDTDLVAGASTGVLRAFDTTAAASAGIFLDEVIGDMPVHSIETIADVSLRTTGGSIIDARDDADANVLANSIDLDANSTGGAVASIGSSANEFEIDSRSASVPATGDVSLEATTNIYLTENDADLQLVLAHTYTGDIRLTVRESTDLDENFVLRHSGSARFAEDATTLPGDDPDADRIVAHGQVFAEQGSVILRVGDDVTLDSNSEIVANLSIDIFGDYGNADVDVNGADPGDGYGSRMVLRGRLVADADVTAGDPVATYVPTAAAPVADRLTQIWGEADVDTIDFGDTTGDGGGTDWGNAGYVFIGSKTRVHAGGDEDLMRVYFLQDAAATTGPLVQTVQEHTLTLDGETAADTYEVYTLGSQGDERNYVVNLLDSGAPDDGSDTATIFGHESTENGTIPGTEDEKYAADDIFLLRTAAFLPNEPSADRPGYVAMMHGDVETYLDVDETTNASTEVQRINYDTAINGRLTVQGRGGNDYFATDDTSITITLDGGKGDDTFRIGQLFGNKRNDLPDEGNLLAQDVFPDMVPTTRGWLSPGIGAPMVMHGGTGDDQFTVYSNQAELRLEGDDDDDIFVVRAFALAAVSTKDWDGSGTIDKADLDAVDEDTNNDMVINKADADETPDDWRDDTIVLDPEGVAVPKIGTGFSTARPLDIRTGGGEDEVQYNVNAPVSIDGGTGFDKVVILGTEFADDIVITDKGIFGGGLNVRYTTVEVVEIDGLEGDDEFFVQSTAFGVAYRVIGGLGSDTINIAGDVTEDIVTRELEGVSGTVNHKVTSGDALYDGLIVDGFDYNVATAEEGGNCRRALKTSSPSVAIRSVQSAAQMERNWPPTMSTAFQSFSFSSAVAQPPGKSPVMAETFKRSGLPMPFRLRKKSTYIAASPSDWSASSVTSTTYSLASSRTNRHGSGEPRHGAPVSTFQSSMAG